MSTLQKTVDNLPAILQKNAKSMMQRMVDAIQNAIAADPQLGASSYCALLLKMSSNDLVHEFDRAIGESMHSVQQAAGPGASASRWLTIEPLDGLQASAEGDFQSSTVVFDKLTTKAGDLGIQGLGAYGKDMFLAALNEAFIKSRVDPAEADKIMPFARQSLNAELTKLYEKLDSL